jgi:putative ABC transport system ATP-binding protein
MSYLPQIIIKNISLTFSANNIYCIVGPSGSGKSTFLNILAKYLKPTSGKIIEQNIKKISWVFQNPFGVKNRTCIDHISLPLLAQNKSRASAKNQAVEYLKAFSVENIQNKLYKEISGGEATRLMLIKGILTKPDLLLVDEPTAQLDTNTSDNIINTLFNLRQKNIITVIASHDKKIENISDVVIDLEQYI